MGNGLLWHTAVLLTSVLAVAIGYYGEIGMAVSFWGIAMLVLLALRPNGPTG